MAERYSRGGARRALPFELPIALESGRRVAPQIYRQLQEAVLDGRLPAGFPLPSSRELAATLKVARNTVVLVYERLRAEGYLESRRGAGFFVRADLHPRSPAELSPSPLRPRAHWQTAFVAPDMASERPEFDFRPGVPDAGRFPHAAWRARMLRQWRPSAIGTGAHIDPAGLPALRAALARHLGVSRGVRADAGDIFVTNGIQQALDLTTRVLLDPGDAVAVEDPGYPLVREALRAQGYQVAGVPVDSEGLVVAAIPPNTRLVYVTPSHQYPLGMTMSLTRRQALLEWARVHDAVVAEDDYDSEFRVRDRPLETLHALDRQGRVVFLGSLSKVLLPTLRLGFAVVPAPLHSAFRAAKGLMDWHTATAPQGALAELIDDGILAQHIRRMRRVYAERHDRLVQELDRCFGNRLVPLPTAGGLHLAATLPQEVAPADGAIAERARARGVGILSLSRHYVQAAPVAGLLFGYGAIAARRIPEGLAVLRECLRD